MNTYPQQMQTPKNKLINGSSKKHNLIFHSTNILKTFFVFLLFMKNHVNAKVFTKKIQKLNGILFPRIWHQMARTKIISNDFQRDRIYLLIVVQFTKLSKPFLVEKELHYYNVIRFYYCIFGVNCLYGNASEGSLVILKMTVKTTIICRIILSIREMIYTREIFPDMSLCLLCLIQYLSFRNGKRQVGNCLSVISISSKQNSLSEISILNNITLGCEINKHSIRSIVHLELLLVKWKME